VAALQISDRDRSRREKLVGMLGSSFDGERLNALSMLQRMADNYRIPIHELLLANGAGSNSEQATRKAQKSDPAEPGPELPSNWRALFAEAQQLNGSRFFLTAWESNFAADLIARGTRFPSPKQVAVIARILEKAAVFNSQTTSAAAEDWEDAP
jgi:hypothetical protein